MQGMLFRAHVLGSKELNRGHVAQNNKNTTFFVGLIHRNHRRVLGVCANTICVMEITTFSPA